MTPKEAIDYMENEIRCIQRARYCDRDCAKCKLVKEDKPLIEAFEGAIKALENQIPKKVKIEKYAPTRCNCGFEFSVHYGDGYYSIPFELKTPYCRNCGQALDWSDKNDRA